MNSDTTSRRGMTSRRAQTAWTGIALCFSIAGCSPDKPPHVSPLGGPLPLGGTAPDLMGGRIEGTDQVGPAQYSYGRGALPLIRGQGRPYQGGGDIALNFADTDVRDAVSQIMTDILHVNYAIDPAVHGRVTLHTSQPLTAGQLLPALQIILAQVHAVLIQADGLYRIVPAQADSANPQSSAAGIAENASLGGSVMVPLRYADAANLAKALQPFLQGGARVTPVDSANAVIVSGEPSARNTLVDVIHAFDVDWLSSQSYALLPVESGNARDMATALQSALHGGNLVQVLPLARVNAVLVVARSARQIDDARRLFALIERNRRATMRSWHVFYVQNSSVNDVTYTLQQAFTPGDVTATPPETTSGTASQLGQSGFTGTMANAMGGGGLGGSAGTGNTTGLMGGSQQGGVQATAGQAPTGQAGGGPAAFANPLLGGLDNTASAEGRPQAMRIISNSQHNAILVYGTDQESDTVEQMLRRIDVMPLQVRIDAVIAEVQLNDALQYGTQFFFKSGGINGVLSTNSQTITTGTLATAAFSHTLPGFIIGGASGGGAPFAIDALQNVTTVHVLSSPQLMVQDNRAARLQVGQLVPVQIGSQSSTIGTSIYNQFTYQPTGVIMQVTPHVSEGGLVTLDVSQEVSSVSPTAASTANAASNPTFNDRSVSSRVVVQDGQTVGLAGLITDSSSRINSGIPWLKNIPVLGVLAGNQNNNRQRTELLILMTPHVIHDQRDAVDLMEDLRDTHPNAANVPDELRVMRMTGSADPQQRLREKVGLGP
ncbi:general secretion pathway protein D [Gluconacetobacter diazotrophicus PA1 5]|uniref:Putative general secretion pathway protein D n=2 Tax=Gluconacetobacter diazotrophicus TaxID=33996 RepID=A9H699_GLUDA|nr:type II secretion system secretin GspD [Gluconacetobacter diazotrophicus]ACI51297.1 general secretion pathway protein D [Gluconacetobacter diazotrophicus PA1 5]TWB09845.1 general secretion pathway protein D [Gluconacetobacter diazotrophicus]CAP54432.1 putative general secretion pathway protein D [Gluconacetobacter diazotrophicus PA1 5]